MDEHVTNREMSWCEKRFRELTKHLIENEEEAARPATARDLKIGLDAMLTVLDEYFAHRWSGRNSERVQ